MMGCDGSHIIWLWLKMIQEILWKVILDNENVFFSYLVYMVIAGNP